MACNHIEAHQVAAGSLSGTESSTQYARAFHEHLHTTGINALFDARLTEPKGFTELAEHRRTEDACNRQRADDSQVALCFAEHPQKRCWAF